ncbi:MAG TPA: hypothetical protein VLK58_04960 [Conexibacter sp.]|nr:hypothetical protein [Conexibacter sp.]
MSGFARWLTLAVLVALAIGTIAGALVPPPSGEPPAYALGTLLVWRIEVAAFVAGVLYCAVIVVALARDGETIKWIGAGGVEIPARRSDASVEETLRADTDGLRRRRRHERLAEQAQKTDRPSTTHQMNVKYLRTPRRGGYGGDHERDDDR